MSGSDNNQQFIFDCWQKYVENDQPIPDHVDGLRQEILDSWKRSKENNISPTEPKPLKLSNGEVQQILNKNSLLISVAHAYIENMYVYVKDTNHAIVLTDKNGYVVDLMCDSAWVDRLREKSFLYLGASRGESYCGTNSIAVCIQTHKPAYVRGAEHFIKSHHMYTCRAAPINDKDGNMVGSLALIGPMELKSLHAMGMICAAADGVGKELAIRNTLNNMMYVNQQLNTIVETMPYGVIMVNQNGIITKYNSRTLKILQISKEELEGKQLSDISGVALPYFNIDELNHDTYHQEVRFENKYKVSIDISLSVKLLLNDSCEKIGAMLLINKQENVRKLATRISGFSAKYTFASIIGNSPEMQYAKKIGMIAAKNASNLLIQGESGTGKELFAQAVHNASTRAAEPFIAINCASIPKSLIESELFGYERGAFTGANKEGSPGKFELADGGTIFLDEIGDMPIELQASLLRVLQNKEITRIGGKQPKKIDVRVISATNKNLLQAIEENSFRRDLYYRLNVISIGLAPLRNRRNDIILLVNHFINEHNFSHEHSVSFSNEALRLMEDYQWPGNVRELENIIERTIHMSVNGIITIDDLPPEIVAPNRFNNAYAEDALQNPPPHISDTGANASPNRFVPVSEEHDMIVKQLQQEHGDVSSAAYKLNIPKRTLYRKIKKYNIQLEQYRKW